MSSTQIENLGPHAWPDETPEAALIKSDEENLFAADHYEILRVRPQADDETIERVYHTLADRFRPDNPSTGDEQTFLRLQEAYDTLSNRAERAKYNLMRQSNGSAARFRLRGREFFDGVKGGQNRRLAVLCLLYRQKISAHDAPGLSILDLELATGCTREELTSALWYLCEKQWAKIGEFTAYHITSEGFDIVESKLENRMELRALATWCYYSLPAGQEGGDMLAFDIAPVISLTAPLVSDESEAEADHYEVLGIGPRADEDTIERVYRTLEGRFRPDNPTTGDAKTFQRIKEAYETLSDPDKREQYDSLKQRTQKPERFRLRGREFFDGIRGEQLRRLAVLCLLYRQSVSELPGLTLLDLEQLTGCTREELGAALWYLREKKWAKSGEFTEYSITAVGFDVVENKLEEQEAARSRAWMVTEESRLSENTQLQIAEASAIEVKTEEGPEAQAAVAQEPAARSEESDAVVQESPGVSVMSYSQSAIAEPVEVMAIEAQKRVIFSMGGKGGVGKTSVMTGLAEWFEENQIPVTMLDLDIENKACGSLTHFFGGNVPKINIHTPAGLDAFVDILAEDAPAILADMGAGAGKITHDWFHKMYPDVHAAGVVFTAVGVVTSDPASVESVVNWAAALQHRVDYVIVENNLTEHTDFTYWLNSEPAEEFRKKYQPSIIRLDYRLADLENTARNHGATLGRVARRSSGVPALLKASLVMRAQSARRRMFEEFDKVKELLLP